MPWNLLTPVRSYRDDEPWISIQATGKLTWSLNLHVKMGRPLYVELHYDPTRARIGIRPTDSPAAFAARKAGRSIGTRPTLLAAEVWKRLQLPIRKCPARLDEATGIWAISIKPDAELFKTLAKKHTPSVIIDHSPVEDEEDDDPKDTQEFGLT